MATICNASRDPLYSFVIYRSFPAPQIPSGPTRYSKKRKKTILLSMKPGDTCRRLLLQANISTSMFTKTTREFLCAFFFFLFSSYVFYKLFFLITTPNWLVIVMLLVLYLLNHIEGDYSNLELTKCTINDSFITNYCGKSNFFYTPNR